MKKFICLVLSTLMLFSLCACKKTAQGTISTQSQKTAAVADNKPKSNSSVKEFYNDFLAGKTTALYNGENVTVDRFIAQTDSEPLYTLFDRNGDNVPELCIDNGYFIVTFWVNNNKLTLWHEGNFDMKILNDGNTLEAHYGGAPNGATHSYITHNYNGDISSSITVSAVLANENDVLESYYELNVIIWGDARTVEPNAIKLTKEQYDKILASIDSIGLDAPEWKVIHKE